MVDLRKGDTVTSTATTGGRCQVCGDLVHRQIDDLSRFFCSTHCRPKFFAEASDERIVEVTGSLTRWLASPPGAPRRRAEIEAARLRRGGR